MPGTCTFNGTSMLTMKLAAEHNKAVIKCEVEQELATSDMHRQSQPDNLVVYCKFSVKYYTIIAFVWGRYVVILTKQKYIDCISIQTTYWPHAKATIVILLIHIDKYKEKDWEL